MQIHLAYHVEQGLSMSIYFQTEDKLYGIMLSCTHQWNYFIIVTTEHAYYYHCCSCSNSTLLLSIQNVI